MSDPLLIPKQLSLCWHVVRSVASSWTLNIMVYMPFMPTLPPVNSLASICLRL